MVMDLKSLHNVVFRLQFSSCSMLITHWGDVTLTEITTEQIYSSPCHPLSFSFFVVFLFTSHYHVVLFLSRFGLSIFQNRSLYFVHFPHHCCAFLVLDRRYTATTCLLELCCSPTKSHQLGH